MKQILIHHHCHLWMMKMIKGGEMHKKRKKLREKRTVKEQRKVAKEVKR